MNSVDTHFHYSLTNIHQTHTIVTQCIIEMAFLREKHQLRLFHYKSLHLMMLDQVYPLVLNKDTLSPAIIICCLMMDQTLFHLGLHQDKEVLDENNTGIKYWKTWYLLLHVSGIYFSHNL